MGNKKVKIDLSVMNGNPFLKGTRLTVFDIVYACKFEGLSAFFESYINVSQDEIREVLSYCKNRKCDIDGSHCGGCSLRNAQDDVYSMKDFINRFAEIRFEDSENIIKGNGQGVMLMPGTPNNLHKHWRGEDTWLYAKEVLSNGYFADQDL